MVYTFPSNEKLWARYAELRADSLRNDGDGETTAMTEADMAWVELVFEDETTVAGLRILGKNKYGALGAGLQVQEGDAWRTVADWRHCRSQGWSEVPLPATTGRRFRVTLRKTPNVNRVQVSELVLLEAVGSR